MNPKTIEKLKYQARYKKTEQIVNETIKEITFALENNYAPLRIFKTIQIKDNQSQIIEALQKKGIFFINSEPIFDANTIIKWRFATKSFILRHNFKYIIPKLLRRYHKDQKDLMLKHLMTYPNLNKKTIEKWLVNNAQSSNNDEVIIQISTQNPYFFEVIRYAIKQPNFKIKTEVGKPIATIIVS